MNRIPALLQLFSCVDPKREPYFTAWMRLELADYSDTHQQWFQVLWSEWQSLVTKVAPGKTESARTEFTSGLTAMQDQTRAHQALLLLKQGSAGIAAVNSLRDLKSLWEKNFPDLKYNRAHNINTELATLVRLFLGVELYRSQPLRMERDALLTMMRSGPATLFSFYHGEFLKKADQHPGKSYRFWSWLQDLGRIQQEWEIRHEGRFPRRYVPLPEPVQEAITYLAWSIKIAEQSLNRLDDQEQLSDLQREAFCRLKHAEEVIRAYQQQMDGKKSPFPLVVPALATVLTTVYDLYQEARPGSERLREACRIFQASAGEMEPSTAINLLALLQNKIKSTGMVQPDAGLTELRIDMYEWALQKGLLMMEPLDYFNLVQMYLERLDWEADEPEVRRQLLQRAWRKLDQRVPSLPQTHQASASLFMKLNLHACERNWGAFDEVNAALNHLPSPGPVYWCSWRWTLAKARVDRGDFDLDVVSFLNNFHRQLQRRMDQLDKKANLLRAQRYQREFFFRHLRSVDFLRRYLGASDRDPAPRQELARELDDHLPLESYPWLKRIAIKKIPAGS